MAVAVRRRRHGDGLPPGLTEPGARRTQPRAFYPVANLFNEMEVSQEWDVNYIAYINHWNTPLRQTRQCTQWKFTLWHADLIVLFWKSCDLDQTFWTENQQASMDRREDVLVCQLFQVISEKLFTCKLRAPSRANRLPAQGSSLKIDNYYL